MLKAKLYQLKNQNRDLGLASGEIMKCALPEDSCTVGAAGTSTPGTAVSRFGAATRRGTATTTSACALPSRLLSLCQVSDAFADSSFSRRVRFQESLNPLNGTPKGISL